MKRAIEIGVTGRQVSHNIARLRKSRGLSLQGLSGRLIGLGRQINRDAICRMESGGRRVDVDDLMAFAIALGVSPSALLLPPIDSPDEKVDVTGAASVPAENAWDWMDGRRRLDQPTADLGTAALEYALYSRPPIRRSREIGGS